MFGKILMATGKSNSPAGMMIKGTNGIKRSKSAVVRLSCERMKSKRLKV